MILNCILISISIVAAIYGGLVALFLYDIRRINKKSKTTHQMEIHRVFQIDH